MLRTGRFLKGRMVLAVTVDLVRMRQIVEELYVAKVDIVFGSAGMNAFRQLLDTLTQLFRTHDPWHRNGSLAIFIRPKPPTDAPKPKYPTHTLVAPSSITYELDQPSLVEISDSGGLVFYNISEHDVPSLSAEAIVYVYENGVERFYVGGQTFRIINPSSVHSSAFCRPTFSSLEAALDQYRTRVALDSSCYILQDAWAEPRRIFLKSKPEATMRRSLQQYLSGCFTDAEVRPEQIVDESHPVDIKITWAETNRRALIEIKWLGRSRNEDGSLGTVYYEGRANEGAKQLAEYLDSNKTAGPGLRTKGYLVVFDARRRGLNEQTLSLTAENGLYYQTKEITYSPAYHQMRADFALPVRFFSAPILN
jgi:hypothetical protein